MQIFGIWREYFTDIGPVASRVCSNCKKDQPWHLCKRGKWITILFIPVVAYDRESLLICPDCFNEIRISHEERKRLTPLAETNLAYAEGRISELAHRNKILQIEANAGAGGARKG